MNDPHVEKLHYWVVANGRMSFHSAEPLNAAGATSDPGVVRELAKLWRP
jgi:hypothetical protein